MNELSSNAGAGGAFRTTRWSIVLKAGRPAGEKAGALETLCRTYWYPLYVFLRRRGYGEHESQDLTQEFFHRLLAGEGLQSVQPEKGRFRTFLLASLKHFLANEWRDANRLKRGGGREFLSWDGLNPEERYQLEPPAAQSAEEVFDRRWAQTLVATGLERLRAEMEAEGCGQRFEVLKDRLQSQSNSGAYADSAKTLGLSEAAVKSAIHRMRRRYAEIIREEISDTVETQAEVEKEIRHLIAILAG